MGFKYKVGDEVRITSLPSSVEALVVKVGSVGVIVEVDCDDEELTYEVRSEDFKGVWWFGDNNLEILKLNREQILDKITYHKQQIKDLESKLEITV